MARFYYWIPALLIALLPFHSPTAQELISYEPLGTVSQQELANDYGPFMEFGVSLFRVQYTTTDLEGLPTTASGLLIAPNEVGRLFPKLICHHGTVNSKEDVPSQLAGGYQLGLVFGGAGYMTLMPDFLGLGDSPGFHPYIHAESEAQASVDMLLAVDQEMLPDLGTDFIANEQLFLTGYSQGGHACAATHRMLQTEYADDFPVTASAPMSGPYDVSGSMLELTLLNEEPYFYPAYLGWVSLMVREVYGIYDDMDQIFLPPYADQVEAFYQEEIELVDLNLFMIDSLTAELGAPVAKGMLHDSIVNILEQSPDHPFLQVLKENNVYDWAPEAPTRLFYCQNDDQVPYQNSLIALDSMTALGAGDLGATDADPSADHAGCVEPAITLGILFFATYQDIGFWLNAEQRTAPTLRFSLSPNPVPGGEFVQIATTEPIHTPLQIELVDLSGQRVGFWEPPAVVDQWEFKLPGSLSPGFYYLRLQSEKGAQTLRLLIQPGR